MVVVRCDITREGERCQNEATHVVTGRSYRSNMPYSLNVCDECRQPTIDHCQKSCDFDVRVERIKTEISS